MINRIEHREPHVQTPQTCFECIYEHSQHFNARQLRSCFAVFGASISGWPSSPHPHLVVLACSGLVILYSAAARQLAEPRSFRGESKVVESVPLDDQVASRSPACRQRLLCRRVTHRQDSGRSTRLPSATRYSSNIQQQKQMSHSLHRSLHRAAIWDNAPNCPVWSVEPTNCTECSATTGRKLQLPSLGHLIAPSALPRRNDSRRSAISGGAHRRLDSRLLASGIYLWWPRSIEAAKPSAKIRWAGGPIRWRDVHALIGVVIAVILIRYVLSGMTLVAVLG